MGRPIEYDLKVIAQELIDWAKKSDSINLNKFCALHDPIINPKRLSEWAKKDPDFMEAYEAAKSFLGFRREENLNSETLHVKAYDLNASVYDYFLKEERLEEKKLDASLKKESEENQEIAINIRDFSKESN